jgi:formylglycine-generating enzyme required for sulfatase activity
MINQSFICHECGRVSLYSPKNLYCEYQSCTKSKLVPLYGFISYRRRYMTYKGLEENDLAVKIKDRLEKLLHLSNVAGGFFLDKTGIEREDFEKKIIKTIEACKNKIFLLILTPNALSIKNDKDDWVMREIRLAIENKLNIIVIKASKYKKDIDFDWPEDLPEDLMILKEKPIIPLIADLDERLLSISFNQIKEEIFKINNSQFDLKLMIAKNQRIDLMKKVIRMIYALSMFFILSLFFVLLYKLYIINVEDTMPIEWVKIEKGSMIINNNNINYEANSENLKIFSEHDQNIKITFKHDFYMSKTEVTVGQYRKCFDAGVCSEPGIGAICNWNSLSILDHNFFHFFENLENYPINCITWQQALTYSKWIGASLPSEMEWEYAARSKGKNILYPWGNDENNCQYSILNKGCNQNKSWRVCSKTKGNTEQGLCDMFGNINEIILDDYVYRYEELPKNGSAFCYENDCELKSKKHMIFRGGSWKSATNETIYKRNKTSIFEIFSHVGFRIKKNESRK